MALNRDFILNDWVPVLRSGKYAQGKKRLRREERYCCLGVAADLMKSVFGTDWRSYGVGKLAFDDIDGLNNGLLSDRFREHIGLTKAQERTLACLNDDRGCTFSDIARFLEHMCSRETAATE